MLLDLSQNRRLSNASGTDDKHVLAQGVEMAEFLDRFSPAKECETIIHGLNLVVIRVMRLKHNPLPQLSE